MTVRPEEALIALGTAGTKCLILPGYVQTVLIRPLWTLLGITTPGKLICLVAKSTPLLTAVNLLCYIRLYLFMNVSILLILEVGMATIILYLCGTVPCTPLFLYDIR